MGAQNSPGTYICAEKRMGETEGIPSQQIKKNSLEKEDYRIWMNFLEAHRDGRTLFAIKANAVSFTFTCAQRTDSIQEIEHRGGRGHDSTSRRDALNRLKINVSSHRWSLLDPLFYFLLRPLVCRPLLNEQTRLTFTSSVIGETVKFSTQPIGTSLFTDEQDTETVSRFIFMPVAPVGVINVRLPSRRCITIGKTTPSPFLLTPIRFPVNETDPPLFHARTIAERNTDTGKNFAPRDDLVILAIYKPSLGRIKK